MSAAAAGLGGAPHVFLYVQGYALARTGLCLSTSGGVVSLPLLCGMANYAEERLADTIDSSGRLEGYSTPVLGVFAGYI